MIKVTGLLPQFHLLQIREEFVHCHRSFITLDDAAVRAAVAFVGEAVARVHHQMALSSDLHREPLI